MVLRKVTDTTRQHSVLNSIVNFCAKSTWETIDGISWENENMQMLHLVMSLPFMKSIRQKNKLMEIHAENETQTHARRQFIYFNK